MLFWREIRILHPTVLSSCNAQQHTTAHSFSSVGRLGVMQQYTARTHCNDTLQQHTVTTHCNKTLQQHTATTHCNALRHTAAHCGAMQHTTTQADLRSCFCFTQLRKSRILQHKSRKHQQKSHTKQQRSTIHPPKKRAHGSVSIYLLYMRVSCHVSELYHI